MMFTNPRHDIIGMRAVYVGDGHPHLQGLIVQVLAVAKRPEAPPILGDCIWTNEELAAAGGVADDDVVEVLLWLPARGCLGCVPSDVRLADLQATTSHRRGTGWKRVSSS
jgi:hypothetical protein